MKEIIIPFRSAISSTFVDDIYLIKLLFWYKIVCFNTDNKFSISQSIFYDDEQTLCSNRDNIYGSGIKIKTKLEPRHFGASLRTHLHRRLTTRIIADTGTLILMSIKFFTTQAAHQCTEESKLLNNPCQESTVLVVAGSDTDTNSPASNKTGEILIVELNV